MNKDRREKYELKRRNKNVSFNIENEEDKNRLNFVDQINFNVWVKSKIDEEIKERKLMIKL